MKKILLTAIFLFITITSLYSQKSFEEDHNVVGLSIGYGNTLHTGSELKMKVLPVMASFEACLKDDLFDANSSLGIGGFMSYSSQTFDKNKIKNKNSSLKYTDVTFGARVNLHYSFARKLDTYVGAFVGYDLVSVKALYLDEGYKPDSNTIIYGAYVGARYYFFRDFAITAEAGYNISYINAGLACRF